MTSLNQSLITPAKTKKNQEKDPDAAVEDQGDAREVEVEVILVNVLVAETNRPVVVVADMEVLAVEAIVIIAVIVMLIEDGGSTIAVVEKGRKGMSQSSPVVGTLQEVIGK